MLRKDFWSLAAALALVGLLLATPARADFEETFQISADDLRIANLVGAVEVYQASGSDFEVKVDVRGDDADPSLVDFQLDEGSEASLIVAFPVEDERDYVYPELGRRSKTSIRFRRDRGDSEGSWWRELFANMGGRHIEIRGSGDGLEMWADLSIGVPKGKALAVVNGVGEMQAMNVEADLLLDVQSGHVRAEEIDGELVCDTGSGHVEATAIRGDLTVDTGSGHVEVSGVEGKKLSIDTGSGHVVLEDAKAEDINVDTGSGSVKVDNAECTELEIDTGSGSVETRDVGADRAKIDTGSGRVLLDLVRMGAGPYNIDTGSGRITLRLPDDASAMIYADAGSGGVDVDLDDAQVHKRDRDYAEVKIGDGEAEIELDTGSGRIVLSRR